MTMQRLNPKPRPQIPVFDRTATPGPRLAHAEREAEAAVERIRCGSDYTQLEMLIAIMSLTEAVSALKEMQRL